MIPAPDQIYRYVGPVAELVARQIRVLQVRSTHALCEIIPAPQDRWPRRRPIPLNRFASGCWQLVQAENQEKPCTSSN